MKAILFVILNVSVCFPRGSAGVEILIPGEVWGVERKNFPGSLPLAMTPPLQHTFNFYPDKFVIGEEFLRPLNRKITTNSENWLPKNSSDTTLGRGDGPHPCGSATA